MPSLLGEPNKELMGFNCDVAEIFFNAMLENGALVQTVSLEGLFTLIHLFNFLCPPLKTPRSWVRSLMARRDVPTNNTSLGRCLLYLMVYLTVATLFINSCLPFTVILVGLGKSHQLFSILVSDPKANCPI